MPCPRLRCLKLGALEPTELSLPRANLPADRIRFPLLRSLSLNNLCFAFSALNVRGLTDLALYHSCSDPCQLGCAGGNEIRQLILHCPSLQRVAAVWEFGQDFSSFDKDLDPEHRLSLQHLLGHAIREVSFDGLPVAWPAPASFKFDPTRGLHQSNMSGLTSLELTGRVTVPEVWSKAGDGGWSIVTSVEPLLHVLQCCPHLTDLNLAYWTQSMPEEPANSLVIFLPNLYNIAMEHMHADFFKYLFTALRVPRLQSLNLSLHADELEPIWTPSLWTWNFPELQWLEIELHGQLFHGQLTFQETGAVPFPLQDILRGGTWTNLQSITVACVDCITKNEMLGALGLLRNPARTPRLGLVTIYEPEYGNPVDREWLAALIAERNTISWASGLSSDFTVRIFLQI
ncbi:hypothetical protein EXIGLDRAFT_698017 [Exidia glandulosa HHB12029]|uniref:F-box domain-containing protein n=1 Tax=Exidia glandulosa HHB12029 TaxID=1314781 RepID=A0A165MTD1_EXIGL|nr:hypothetical protein EXIGLDRAFT_698017 [Exidia glandulosa HHB12029]